MEESKLFPELRRIFGEENVITNTETLRQKSYDSCPLNLFDQNKDVPTASAIVMPNKGSLGNSCNKQLENLVKLANAEGLKIIPIGGLTGVRGAVASQGGEIVVDSSKLRHMVGIREPEDDAPGEVSVQAGVTGLELEQWLKIGPRPDTTFFYPASYKTSTPAGWVSTGASGHNSAGFGDITHCVNAVSGVDGKGETFYFTGDNLKKIFRMEGTTGIITRVWMKTHKLPIYSSPQSFRFYCLESVAEFLRNLAAHREEFRRSEVVLCSARAYDFLDFNFISKPHKEESKKSAIQKRIRHFLEKILCHNHKLVRKMFVHNIVGHYWTVIVHTVGNNHQKLTDASDKINRLCRFADGRNLGPEIASAWLSHPFKQSHEKLVSYFNSGITVDTFDCTPEWNTVIGTYAATDTLIFENYGIASAHLCLDLDQPYLYTTLAISGRSREKYLRLWDNLAYTCHVVGTKPNHHHNVGRLGRKFAHPRYAIGEEWYQNIAIPAKKEHDPNNILNPGNLRFKEALFAQNQPR